MDENWIDINIQKPVVGVEVLLAFDGLYEACIGYLGVDEKRWYASTVAKDYMIDGDCRDSQLQFAPSHWMKLPIVPFAKNCNQ